VNDDEITTILPLDLGASAWAIRREVLPRLLETHRVTMASRAGTMTAAVPRAASRSAGVRAGGSIAVLPLSGVISPRGSWLSMLFGGSGGGLQGFRESFREALASPDVGAIVIDVDSPGGIISLVPETAAEIREARGTKPIIAVADCQAASAAYWLAAQADEVVITPSGRVGSIGVYMLHEDWSKFNEEFGVDVTFISAGRYKVDGNSEEPLSESAKADWQENVDTLYSLFVAEVAAGRGTTSELVQANYGEGRMFFADAAVAAGLADRVDTIEGVIGRLLEPGSSGSASSAANIGRAAILAIPIPAASGEDQPRCPSCGRFLEDGETCKNCNPDPDDDESGEDDESDEDENDEPDAMNTADRAARAEVLLS
jgi:signal peptide peptidase SppA